MDKADVGNRIKLARALYNERTGEKLTQVTLSVLTGISRSSLNDAENGRTLLDIIKLDKIAKVCGVTIDFFVNPSFGENEIPEELKDLGVEYLVVTKELKEKGLTPDEIKKIAEVAKMFKK